MKNSEWPLRPIIAAVALRLILLIYGIIHDVYGNIQYTDVDYIVVTDAARLFCENRSPYMAVGFRYPPFLAVFLSSTCYFHESGKLIFIAADILVVILIALNISDSPSSKQWVWFWAVNPLAAAIPTRGSFDPLSNMLVLACLLAAKEKKPLQCGAYLGTAIYLRVYPVIYVPAIGFYLLGDFKWSFSFPPYDSLRPTLGFILSAAASFGILFYVSLDLYGQDYLEAAILYHTKRLDYRHNFSPHFLWIYLAGAAGGESSRTIALFVSTLPQVSLVLLSSLVLARRHLPVSMLVSTMIFVSFNKVSTAQYFTWYSVFIPIVFATGAIRVSLPFIVAAVFWVISICAWLYFAYTLEFLGLNRFTHVWACSLLFQFANVSVIANVIEQVRSRDADKSESTDSAALLNGSCVLGNDDFRRDNITIPHRRKRHHV